VSEFACLPDNGMVILKQCSAKTTQEYCCIRLEYSVVFNATLITTNYTL